MSGHISVTGADDRQNESSGEENFRDRNTPISGLIGILPTGNVSSNVEKLEGSANYRSWSFEMKNLFIKRKGWGYVNGNIRGPPESDVNRRHPWDQNDSDLLADINLNMGRSEYVYVENAQSSHEEWMALEKVYKNSDSGTKILLFKRLTHIRFEDSKLHMPQAHETLICNFVKPVSLLTRNSMQWFYRGLCQR